MIAALCVGVLLFLWWGWAQVRAGRLRELPLGQPGVTLSGPALAAAMAERAESVDGVVRAQVTLLGRPRRLRAHVTLVLAADGRPEAVQHDLAAAGRRRGEGGGRTPLRGGRRASDGPAAQGATTALMRSGAATARTSLPDLGFRWRRASLG